MNGTDIYREWAPPAAWRSTVRCLWEHRVGTDQVHRVVPDGCADLLFTGDDVSVIGLHDVVHLPELPAGTHIRGIRLRPSAVRTVLGLPASELRNTEVPLDWSVRLEGEPPGRVRAALSALATSTVDEAASVVNLSGRQLRRLLHDEVGLGPKAFQRVVRLQRFLASTAPLGVAAVECGYADQAHLTREVKALCGLTPAALRASRTEGRAVPSAPGAHRPEW